MKGIRELSKDLGLTEKQLKELFTKHGILVEGKPNPVLVDAGLIQECLVWVNRGTLLVKKVTYNEYYIAKVIREKLTPVLDLK